MGDEPVEWQVGDFTVSTDRTRIDFNGVHAFLASSYWAEGIPRGVLERAIEHSITFGIYHGVRQVGFARVVTDRATYAYLADVFVVAEYRGRGLSKWMLECVLAHPDLQRLRRFALFTRDAQTLYERYGFAPPQGLSTYLERRDPDVYRSP
jgi:GNAT superfamily N-acetyltransferase